MSSSHFYLLEALGTLGGSQSATGYTVHEFSMVLSPFSIGSETRQWTFDAITYSGLTYTTGLEVKDNNTLLIGGSSIYEMDITTNALQINELFVLPGEDSYIIGDMVYNPYTQRLIMLSYGTGFTDYWITEVLLNGTVWVNSKLTSDFSGETPSTLFITNNNLYMVTAATSPQNSSVYQINLSNYSTTLIPNSQYNQYTSGMAAPNQCNNVSLIP